MLSEIDDLARPKGPSHGYLEIDQLRKTPVGFQLKATTSQNEGQYLTVQTGRLAHGSARPTDAYKKYGRVRPYEVIPVE